MTRPRARLVCLLLVLLASVPAASERTSDVAPEGAPDIADLRLDPGESALRQAVYARAPEMQALLARWVAMNTGSFHLAGLERFAGEMAEPLRALQFEVEIRPGPEIDYPGRGSLRTGPLVVARRVARGDVAERAPRLLLSGHYDTVFEPSSPFQEMQPDPDAPGRATGPGASDMKGGLVVMLHALRALEESGDLDGLHVEVILNGDEEIGSLGSRPALERAARQADFGFVFESARDKGEMVRSRRGLGQFFLTVKGVAAHAGSAHEEGRSAVLEMAHKILAIEAMTDYARGVTLNTGTVRGGAKRNIVPDRAEAWIDLRYDDPALGEKVRERIERLVATPVIAGTHATVWGTLHRPPKLETDAVRRLLSAHENVALDLGLTPPPPIHAGGGTDGSLMGAVGLPTLDSMGVRGGAAHTRREYVRLDSLPERAAIAAILFRRLRDGSAALRPMEGAVEFLVRLRR